MSWLRFHLCSSWFPCSMKSKEAKERHNCTLLSLRKKKKERHEKNHDYGCRWIHVIHIETKIKAPGFLKLYDNDLNAYAEMILEIVYKHEVHCLYTWQVNCSPFFHRWILGVKCELASCFASTKVHGDIHVAMWSILWEVHKMIFVVDHLCGKRLPWCLLGLLGRSSTERMTNPWHGGYCCWTTSSPMSHMIFLFNILSPFPSMLQTPYLSSSVVASFTSKWWGSLLAEGGINLAILTSPFFHYGNIQVQLVRTLPNIDDP